MKSEQWRKNRTRFIAMTELDIEIFDSKITQFLRFTLALFPTL